MPRPLRILYPNAYYHVFNRGLEKREIFYNDKGYEIFLDLLGEACKKFSVIIHAYCLMPNHYHLLAQTPNANLDKFMQYVNGFYTQKFNKFMDRDGPLFRGRFKSLLVEDDSYLTHLSSYIHRNPLNLVEKLNHYKWSSYPSYLGLKESPLWLSKDKILSTMQINDPAEYENFVLMKDMGSDPFFSSLK